MRDDLALWVAVDPGRIRRNVARLKSLLSPGRMLLAVVKANGYGHGDVACARAAVEGGADWLGVARVEEGASLREAGVEKPILLLAEPPPGLVARAIELELVPTLYTRGTAERFAETARSAGRTVAVHVKVDTGMHRYGVLMDDAVALIDEITKMKSLQLQGIWSHFAVAEDVLNPYTKQQYERFVDVLEALGTRAEGLIRHLANSAGLMTFPDSHFDMVRAGISIYGIYPSPDLSDRVLLEPALSFKARVGLVKRLKAGEPISYGQRYTTKTETNVVTVPIGYADGLRRGLTNRGEVLIGGRRYRISGTVTMDHFLVDVSDDKVEIGDEVVLIGGQGGEEITAQEIADLLETIPYEVVCSISARVRRLYV